MTDLAAAAVEHLGKLVAFDTTSHKSNLAVIAHLESFLGALGFRLARLPAADGEAKANLHASIGPETPGGVILSGHTDVVPVEGRDWSTDPWTLTEKDGRLYGRGACDMKGFLACCLALAPAMAKADLRRPIRLAFSYDEEVGLRGAPPLVAAMARDLPEHEACIVGEPTRMAVVDGHKGVAYFKTTVTGRAAHSSSRGVGVSAVAMAGRLIAALDEMEREIAAAAPADSPFDPPHTTFGANMVEGGTAGNILADRCVFVWDCRAAPGASAAEVRARFDRIAETMLARVRRFAPEAAVTTETIADGPALIPCADNRARDLCFALTGRNAAQAVSYATEGGIFQREGMDTVVCGPGDIAQAHQPDEFVERDQLAECCGFLQRLLARMTA